jgi:hypothetical protein
MSYKKPRPTRPLATPVEQLTTARAILQRGLDAGTVEADLIPKIAERIARIDRRLKELTESAEPKPTSTSRSLAFNGTIGVSSPSFEVVAEALDKAGLADPESLSGSPFPTWTIMNDDGYLKAQLWKHPEQEYWCACRFIGGYNQGAVFGSLTEIAELVASWT